MKGDKMKQNAKYLVAWLVGVIGAMPMLGFSNSGYVPRVEVCSAIQDVYRHANSNSVEEASLMDSTFELRFDESSYRPLVVAMSNNWHEVLSHMDSYAANRTDRLLLINTGWWYDESTYLGYLELLSGLVVSNGLSSIEFDAFEGAAWNRPNVASSVFRRYGEASVSNALERIMSFSQRTNHWRGVFSGEARERYECQLDEGLWR